MEVPTTEEFEQLKERVQTVEVALSDVLKVFDNLSNILDTKEQPVVLEKRTYQKTTKIPVKRKKWSNTEIAILETAYTSKRNRKQGGRIKRTVMKSLRKRLRRSSQAITAKALVLGLTK